MIQGLLQCKAVMASYLMGIHPAVMFLAIALLPLVGVPASMLWIAAGARFGSKEGGFISLFAMIVTLIMGYWAGRYYLRSIILRILSKRHYRIPQVRVDMHRDLILMVRITPGIPLFLQNYFLGLSEVAFAPYMMISLPIQSAYMLAFVCLGKAAMQTNTWRLIIGICFLTATVIGFKLYRSKLKSGRYPDSNPGGTGFCDAPMIHK